MKGSSWEREKRRGRKLKEEIRNGQKQRRKESAEKESKHLVFFPA